MARSRLVLEKRRAWTRHLQWSELIVTGPMCPAYNQFSDRESQRGACSRLHGVPNSEVGTGIQAVLSTAAAVFRAVQACLVEGEVRLFSRRMMKAGEVA